MDDVINVAGHRLGTKELESACLTVTEVAEAAVVPLADVIKGFGIAEAETLQVAGSILLVQQPGRGFGLEIPPLDRSVDLTDVLVVRINRAAPAGAARAVDMTMKAQGEQTDCRRQGVDNDSDHDSPPNDD